MECRAFAFPAYYPVLACVLRFDDVLDTMLDALIRYDRNARERFGVSGAKD